MLLRRGALLLLALVVLTASLQASVQPLPGGARDQHDTYIPIIPPDSPAGFLAETQTITNFLANLPIDATMAHDVLQKLLDGITVHLGDIITQVLKYFGIDYPIDLGHFSFRWLLSLLHYYSYAQDMQVHLLADWTQGMTPQQEECLKRLYLAQIATQVAFQSDMQMADDAAQGLYDLVDLVLGANKIVDKICKGLGSVPVAGELVARIKLMITQRIVFAFQNAVQLATAPMSEPNRSRIRAICTALATTYVKWKDIELHDGFEGISAELVTKVGFAVLGKSSILMAPKLGVVSFTQPWVDRAALTAKRSEFSGTWEQARHKLLDDEDESQESGFTEKIVKNTMRKSKLSLTERQIANVAGSIAQIAQLVSILDPSSIARIITIVGRVLAGGLQIHSIYNSVAYFYHVPRELKSALVVAFHPDQPPPQLEGDFIRFETVSPEDKASAQTMVREAHTRFVGAVEEVAEALSQPGAEVVVASLERLDASSRELTERMASLGNYQRPVTVVPGAVHDPLFEGLLDHQMKLAAAEAAAIPVVLNKRDAHAVRAFRSHLEELEQSTRTAVNGIHAMINHGMVEPMGSIEISTPGAVRLGDMMTLKAKVSNSGHAPVKNIQFKMIPPEGFRSNSATDLMIPQLEPGQSRTVSWTVVGSAASVTKRACLTVFALSDEGLWASRFVHVSF